MEKDRPKSVPCKPKMLPLLTKKYRKRVKSIGDLDPYAEVFKFTKKTNFKYLFGRKWDQIRKKAMIKGNLKIQFEIGKRKEALKTKLNFVKNLEYDISNKKNLFDNEEDELKDIRNIFRKQHLN